MDTIHTVVVFLIGLSVSLGQDIDSTTPASSPNGTDTEKRFGFMPFGAPGSNFLPWQGGQPAGMNEPPPFVNGFPDHDPSGWNARPWGGNQNHNHNHQWQGNQQQGPNSWNQQRPGNQQPGSNSWNQQRPGNQQPGSNSWNQQRPESQQPSSNSWNQQRPGNQQQGSNSWSRPKPEEINRPDRNENWNRPSWEEESVPERPGQGGRPPFDPWNRPDDMRPVAEEGSEVEPPKPPYIKKQDKTGSNHGWKPEPVVSGIFFPRPERTGRTPLPTEAPWGGNGAVPFPTFVPDEPNAATTTTPFRGTRRTTPPSFSTTTEMSVCELNCRSTLEFNPVCGSDGTSYNNPGKLKCAQRCGKSITINHYGNCRPTSSTAPPPGSDAEMSWLLSRKDLKKKQNAEFFNNQ